jgi:hypothetical protein
VYIVDDFDNRLPAHERVNGAPERESPSPSDTILGAEKIVKLRPPPEFTGVPKDLFVSFFTPGLHPIPADRKGRTDISTLGWYEQATVALLNLTPAS